MTEKKTVIDEVLGLEMPKEEESEVDKIARLRHDCGNCGGVNTVEKDFENIYVNSKLNFKLEVPAHICSRCDSTVYEPDDYLKILEAEEKAQGRPYVKVVIKHGRISKYSVH